MLRPGYLATPGRDSAPASGPGRDGGAVSQGLYGDGPASADGPVAQPLNPTPQRLERERH